jgi:hypothetical protein
MIKHGIEREGRRRTMASMLTTVDNPFDPRQDYISWYAWDVEQGYNTCSYLARIAKLSTELPQMFQESEIEQAMDEIIAVHDGGLYKKLPVSDAA